MNKKSQFLTLALIITLLILAGLYFAENTIKQKYNIINYVGDISTNLTYNIKSNNPNCNVDNIGIHKQNIIYFRNIEEAITQGFNLDLNCD